MKVLMISSDRQAPRPGSAVSERLKEYGKLVEQLDVVLLCDKAHQLPEVRLSENVIIHPTNSINKFFRPLDAVRIGGKITYDLITTQDPFECGWAGMKLKEEKKVPLEVQLHTDLSSPQFSGFLNFIRKIVARKVLRCADGVRVVADYLKSKIPNRNTYTLPIYVDRKRIEGEPRFDLHQKYGFKRVILAVSRLSPEKNIRLAIETISRIPDAGLVIVGDGPERNKFRETDRVKFAGWQEDLVSYYKTADVFVQTSKFEGYGLALVEAGLSGLPVVTTPVGVARDLKNVLIAESVSEFGEKIGSLLGNESKRKQLGENLKRELEEIVYTKEAFLQKLRESWESLARKQ